MSCGDRRPMGLVAVVLLTGCTAGQGPSRPAVVAATSAVSTDAPVLRPKPITATPTPVFAAPRDAARTPAATGDALLPPSFIDYTDPRVVADAYTRARGRYTWTDPAGYARAQTSAGLATPALVRRSAPTAAAVDRLVTAHESSGVTAVATTVAKPTAGQPAAGDTTVYITCSFTTAVTYRGMTRPDVESQVWELRLLRGPDGRWRVDAVTSAAAADPVDEH